MATHHSALTSTRTSSPSSEVVTTRQTDGAAHKLKPRSFHKSAHLRIHSADFHPSVNRAWHLPYILLPMVCAHYCAPYPKRPCVEHEASICCPCCMMSLVLEPSTKFSYVSWSVLWLYHQVVTDVTAWHINPNPSCSKNRKYKNKSKRQIKMKEKKISWVHFLWSWQVTSGLRSFQVLKKSYMGLLGSLVRISKE